LNFISVNNSYYLFSFFSLLCKRNRNSKRVTRSAMLLIHNNLFYSALGDLSKLPICYFCGKSLCKPYKQAKICSKPIKYDMIYSNLIGRILIKKISENYRTRSWLVWFIFKLVDSLFTIFYRLKKVSMIPSLWIHNFKNVFSVLNL